TEKRLTNNAGDSGVPSIAASGSNVHVVWRDSTPGNWEIYHAVSYDNGATWTEKRLTNNSGASQHPSISTGTP
ncbi:MAG: hypothetical protein NUW09_06415, partial [Deltaproteobacteria bacterium]|nr:hypothetical protein [Deltaproteobacteria bacterium]